MEKNPNSQGKISKESGRRLKQVREHLGLQPQEFASILGVKPQKLVDMERGKVRVPDELALHVDGKYSINFKWLITGIGRMIRDNHEKQGSLSSSKHGDYSPIPQVKSELSGEDGSLVVSDDVKEYCQFRTEWLQRNVGPPKGIYFFQVAGDAMYPTIQNGDTVMLDTGSIRIFDSNIYALRMDNTVIIKRLGLLPGDKVRIISDNKNEYYPVDVDKKDLHVLGRVVWFARTLVRSD